MGLKPESFRFSFWMVLIQEVVRNLALVDSPLIGLHLYPHI